MTLCLCAAIGPIAVSSAAAQESWDAIYLSGTKVGFVHTYVEKVPNQGRTYLRVRIDMEQRLKRGRDFSVTRLTYGTIEAMDGQVLRLDTLTDTGQQRIRVKGDVKDGQMNLIMEVGGKTQEAVIPWGPEVRGPYAPEQSMAREPMKAHETRSLKMFMPTLNKICDIELVALDVEPTIMGDGKNRNLLHVEQKTKVDGVAKPEFDVRLWVDSEGQVLKQEVDILGGYVQYRTNKEAAKARGGPIQFDLIQGSVIKVKHLIPNSDRSRMVRYQLTFKGNDLAQVIPTDPRQSLEAGASKNSGILKVESVGPLDGKAGPAEVDQQYVKPNALVTSDDGRVRALAAKATRGAQDPWQKAVAIQKWVFDNVTEKNFKTAFAAASEVARNLAGDCTEHAVLAAAMCRAVGIPARVVVGMIYVEEQSGFGYHMWDEVYVNQRWVAIDPSWEQSMVDAVHIKISESSLEGVAPFEAFTPIIRVMGKLEIDPIEFR
jgi:Transglutaminase-like superfamily